MDASSFSLLYLHFTSTLFPFLSLPSNHFKTSPQDTHLSFTFFKMEISVEEAVGVLLIFLICLGVQDIRLLMAELRLELGETLTKQMKLKTEKYRHMKNEISEMNGNQEQQSNLTKVGNLVDWSVGLLGERQSDLRNELLQKIATIEVSFETERKELLKKMEEMKELLKKMEEMQVRYETERKELLKKIEEIQGRSETVEKSLKEHMNQCGHGGRLRSLCGSTLPLRRPKARQEYGPCSCGHPLQYVKLRSKDIAFKCEQCDKDNFLVTQSVKFEIPLIEAAKLILQDLKHECDSYRMKEVLDSITPQDIAKHSKAVASKLKVAKMASKE